MEYKINAELLQAIIGLLEQMPAKQSFQVLKALDILVYQQSQKKEEKKND